MSLEKIDQYIRELKAIKDYSVKCLELNEARSHISELLKDIESQKKIISMFKDTIEKQSYAISYIHKILEKEVNLKRRVGPGSEIPQHSNREPGNSK